MTFATWLDEKLKQPGKTGAALGKVLGIDATKVSKMRSGERRPQAHEIALIERYIGEPSPLNAGQSEPEQQQSFPPPNASAPEPAKYGRTRRPMYGQAFGGKAEEGQIILNGQALAHLVAPPAVEFVPAAFAVQIAGTSMLERFRPGDVAWIDPSRAVRAGDDVLIELLSENGFDRIGYVKRFVSRGAKDLVVEQLNPAMGEDRQLRFPLSRVVRVSLIVDIGIAR